MSAFILKIIALISMTCDHTSYLIFGKFSFLNLIGRFAFPIFAFQISEGYIHTKSLKRYLLRLFLFALISQAPFALFRSSYFSSFALNVFFTLFLGLGAIAIFDMFHKLEYKEKLMHYLNDLFGIICVIILSVIAQISHCDYGAYGVAIIFLFYLLKNHKLLMNIVFILCTILYQLKNLLLFNENFKIYLFVIIFTCLPLVFIELYNNKKGKDIKFVLYLFYPIHLLILYALSFIVHN